MPVLSSNRERSSLGERGVSQKKKGRAQRKGIKRGRINSNEDQRGEQESVRGINEFHPGATSVKWQLLSAASAADWQHKICQRQAATGGHVSVCLCVQASGPLSKSLLALSEWKLSNRKGGGGGRTHKGRTRTILSTSCSAEL